MGYQVFLPSTRGLLARQTVLGADRATETSGPAIGATPEGDSIPRAQLFLVYALVRGAAGHRNEALRLFDEALSTTRRLRDRDLLAGALLIGALVAHVDEAPERVVEHFRELEATCAGDLSIGSGLLGLQALVIGVGQCQMALVQLGRAAEAEALLLRLRGIASGSGNPIQRGALHASVSMWLARRGDLAGALEEARHAFEQSRRTSNPISRSGAHSGLAFALTRAGQHAEAERELEGAIRIGLDGRVSAISGVHNLSRLALLRLARGDLAAAREAAQRGLDFALGHGLGGAEAANRVALARVLLAEGGAKALAAAREEIERAEVLCREHGLQTTLALVEEVRAEVAALAADGAACERALREAARLHRACGDTWAAERAESRIPT